MNSAEIHPSLTVHAENFKSSNDFPNLAHNKLSNTKTITQPLLGNSFKGRGGNGTGAVSGSMRAGVAGFYVFQVTAWLPVPIQNSSWTQRRINFWGMTALGTLYQRYLLMLEDQSTLLPRTHPKCDVLKSKGRGRSRTPNAYSPESQVSK